MCTTTESGSEGSNASLVIRLTSERFSSYLCVPDSLRIHFRMKLVVGTVTILPAKVLKAYLPGSRLLVPHAALLLKHQLAVLVVVAGDVRAGLAGVGDDDADPADLDDGLVDRLDCGEEAVDVVGPFDEDLELPAASPAGAEERLGVLEVVVIIARVGRVVADDGGDDLVDAQRRPVVHRDHAEHVIGAADHHRRKSAALGDDIRHLEERFVFVTVEREVEDAALCDDDELS